MTQNAVLANCVCMYHGYRHLVKFVSGPPPQSMKLSSSNVHVYVFLISLAAAIMLLQAQWLITGELVAAAATLLLIAVISEAGSIPIGIGTARSSISFIPFLAAIVLVGPAWAMAIGGITNLVSISLFHRKPFVKVVFNTAKEIVAIGAGALIYVWLGGDPSLSDFRPSLLAFMVAVLIFFPISRGTTAIAIALSTRTRLREAWDRLGAGHQVFDLGASTLGLLLAFLYVELDLVGPLLVVVPLMLEVLGRPLSAGLEAIRYGSEPIQQQGRLFRNHRLPMTPGPSRRRDRDLPFDRQQLVGDPRRIRRRTRLRQRRLRNFGG